MHANWEAGREGDTRGEFTDEQCDLLLPNGVTGTARDWSAGWDSKPSMCVNDAASEADCLYTEAECDAIGFTDEYSCVAPLPTDGSNCYETYTIEGVDGDDGWVEGMGWHNEWYARKSPQPVLPPPP
jgi:hypothetical protein